MDKGYMVFGAEPNTERCRCACLWWGDCEKDLCVGDLAHGALQIGSSGR